jgi:hypothetical protein
LRNIPDLPGIFQRGCGVAPVIRNLKNIRLNILQEGAYVFGSYPIRVYPPMADASMNGYDSITIIKGCQMVTSIVDFTCGKGNFWPKVPLANNARQWSCPDRERQVTGHHRTQGLIQNKVSLNRGRRPNQDVRDFSLDGRNVL